MMSFDGVIVPAREADLAAVQRLSQQAFSVPWPRSELERELSRSHASLRVLRGAAGIVGFVNYWRLGDELQIMNVAVAEEQRRCGCGRALVRYVIEAAHAVEVSAVTLEVRASNRPGIRLYESLGFERLGVRQRYYSDNGEDALLMRHPLARRPAMDLGGGGC